METLNDLVWQELVLENNFSLIEKLNRIEAKEDGFGTIVVPKEGFSENDRIHNMVIDWLKNHGVNIVNVGLEIGALEYALYGRKAFPE